MNGVIIKNKKMPNSCGECEFLLRCSDQNFCTQIKETGIIPFKGMPKCSRFEGRLPDCPLASSNNLIDGNIIKQTAEWMCQRFIDSKGHSVVGLTVETIERIVNSLLESNEETEKEGNL